MRTDEKFKTKVFKVLMDPCVSHLGVCIGGFQLKFSDGLPHSLLDPHARDLQQRQRVVHGLDGDVERLGNLMRTVRDRTARSHVKPAACLQSRDSDGGRSFNAIKRGRYKQKVTPYVGCNL